MSERDSGDELAPLLAEAWELAEREQWYQVYSLLLEQESRNPDHPQLLCMLGLAAQEIGAAGHAYDFFRRCLDQHPEDPVILAMIGRGIAAADDPDAERVLRLAAMTAPQLMITRLSYGAYLAREGLFDLALAELEAATALEPENDAVRLEYGLALLRTGTIEPALAQLAEAAALAPGDVAVQVLYGLALVEAGQIEDAVAPLLSASEASPEDPELHLAAALASASAGFQDEAWAALARADLAAAADRALIREVEERLESGADAARDFLHHELAAPLLRARLADRG